ncbi:hypothetical protein KKG24_05490 [Patescibacteria group bacterium]|nr:hypothetical protein [Patescibacteria group bacterium]
MQATGCEILSIGYDRIYELSVHIVNTENEIMFFRRNVSKRKKISEMVLDFAGDYIAMGEDIEEKQQYLNSAVSAWNIACLDEKARKRSIKKYMSEYRKLNPTQSKQDFRDVEEDLRLLIKQKEKLYPEDRVQIVTANIQEINRKIHVTVASLNIN